MTSQKDFSQATVCLEDYSYQDPCEIYLSAIKSRHYPGQSAVPLSISSKKINKESHINQQTSSTKLSNRKEKAYWQPEEDAQVLELVHNIGCKWTEIGRRIGQRTGKQVRDRYNHFLNPNINKDKWTKQEDELLISLYRQIGSRWCQISQEMRGRTENQVKNRFYSKIKGSASLQVSLPDSPQKSSSNSNQEALSPKINFKDLANVEQAPDLRGILEKFISNDEFYLDFAKEPLYEKETLSSPEWSDCKKEDSTEPTLTPYQSFCTDAIFFDFYAQDMENQTETIFLH